MRKDIVRLRSEFMNVVGCISIDELTKNPNVVSVIQEIYEDFTNISAGEV